MKRCLPCGAAALLCLLIAMDGVYASPGKPVFKRLQLETKFFSEGAHFADFNKDGHNDIVSGPYWYAGPEFKRRFEYQEVKEFQPKGYSNNFLAFTPDVDRDGWKDILVVGFPGAEAFWFQNPKRKGIPGGKGEHWKRCVAYRSVDNESPGMGDIDSDGEDELLFHTGGYFAYAKKDPADPTKEWALHKISAKIAGGRYEHGFGYGDLNGDGRVDILCKRGWLEQPASLAPDSEWKFHEVVFTPQRDEKVSGGYALDRVGQGGAQMLVYDFDGDGDNDVLTSIEAHGYGLAWHEQVAGGDNIRFKMHLIQGWKPDQSAYGLVYTQMHAFALTDMDGDGVKDVVTGKRYWAHNGHDPEGNAAPLLYWYRTVRRGPGDVDLVPHKVDDDSGVGTQVVAGDVNGDGRPDIVVGNKKGTFLFLQRS